MTILIFFAIILVAIVLAIFINRLIRCPLLVGLIFFSITLLVAVILSNITLVILAIILGFIAFISAFLDCVFKSSRFFRNNKCLRCHNPFDDDEDDDNEDDDDCRRRRRRRRRCNDNDTLRIINNDGEVIARIRGNRITCFDDDEDNNNNNNCGCCSNGRRGNNIFLDEPSNRNTISTASDVIIDNGVISTNNSNSSCGCSRRFRR